MSEVRDNSGTLGKNKRKDKDSHPDLTGSAMVHGQEVWISGWFKRSNAGENFMSLSFKAKEAKASGDIPAEQAAMAADDPQAFINDDITF